MAETEFESARQDGEMNISTSSPEDASNSLEKCFTLAHQMTNDERRWSLNSSVAFVLRSLCCGTHCLRLMRKPSSRYFHKWKHWIAEWLQKPPASKSAARLETASWRSPNRCYTTSSAFSESIWDAFPVEGDTMKKGRAPEDIQVFVNLHRVKLSEELVLCPFF